MNAALLVVATSNPGKLRELSRILPETTELVSINDLGIPSPEESGRTFLDNARLKAEHASRMSGLAAIADDSGLEVDALGGQPGVSSARFAGPSATDDENNRKLIRQLMVKPTTEWPAKFVSAVAFHAPSGYELTAMGTLTGKIVCDARGTHGFGYDPHFLVCDPVDPRYNGRTLAELTLEEKSEISHRWRAYESLVEKARLKVAREPDLNLILNS